MWICDDQRRVRPIHGLPVRLLHEQHAQLGRDVLDLHLGSHGGLGLWLLRSRKVHQLADCLILV